MASAEQSTRDYFRYRIRRDTSGLVAWFRQNWQNSRRFKWGAGALGAMAALAIVGWVFLSAEV